MWLSLTLYVFVQPCAAQSGASAHWCELQPPSSASDSTNSFPKQWNRYPGLLGCQSQQQHELPRSEDGRFTVSLCTQGWSLSTHLVGAVYAA
jgi:hypothetical protein